MQCCKIKQAGELYTFIQDTEIEHGNEPSGKEAQNSLVSSIIIDYSRKIIYN
jgi:hypothetical protein